MVADDAAAEDVVAVDVEDGVVGDVGVEHAVVDDVDVEHPVGDDVDVEDVVAGGVYVEIVVVGEVDVEHVVADHIDVEDVVAGSAYVEAVVVGNIDVGHVVADDAAAEDVVADVSMVNNDAVEDVLVKGLHVHAGDLDGILWEDADVSSVLFLTIDNVGKRDNRITRSHCKRSSQGGRPCRARSCAGRDSNIQRRQTTRSPPQSTI